MALFYGCVSGPPTHELVAHPHLYPLTKVMGYYHVRLTVDHREGELTLLFEDASEKPARLLHLERIRGKVVLPDGEVRTEIFRPVKPLLHKTFIKRFAGAYFARADWVKSTPAFDLQVVLPFEGRVHTLDFHYEMSEEFHRRELEESGI